MEILVELKEMGYTKANMAPLVKLLKQAKFNLLMSHVVIDAIETSPSGREYTKTQILKLLEEDKINRPILQGNAIYAYCKIGNYDLCSMINKLERVYRSDKIEQTTVALPSLSLYETHYYPVDINIVKNITFVDSSKKEVGWYNFATNLLWISDIGHYPEKIVPNLEHILSCILSIQKVGFIIPLPNLTIGADPEFEIFDAHGGFVPAHDLINDPDRIKEVGVDGHADTGELRPTFATNPIKLANNIKKAVKKLLRDPTISHAGYKVYCGGGTAKHLGGHIHFNTEMPANPVHLQHVLYDLIGFFVRDSMNRKSRRYQERRYMDRDGNDVFRVAENHKGIEWRLLPSFILNDNICKAILCTTWCVIKEYFGRGLGKEVYPAEEVTTVLRSLALYPHYKRWIEEFIHLFITNKTSMEEKELRESWKVLSTKYNIIISSNISWVKEYFTPQNVKLNKDLTINIVTNGVGELALFTPTKLPDHVINLFSSFAKEHMVAFRFGEQGIPFDAYISIPWHNPVDANIAFKKLKVLVKFLIGSINDHYKSK